MLATISVSIAYSVGAIFLSLGSSMARDLTGTTDLLVIGILLGSSSLSIGITALFLSRVGAHAAIVVGAGLSLLGLVFMVAASATGSLAFLLAWCLIGGVGYSFAFTGGLSLVSRVAPSHHRGATLSLLYLYSYLAQALTAVGAGALATNLGLSTAVEIAAPVLATMCAAAIALVVVERRGAQVAATAPPT